MGQSPRPYVNCNFCNQRLIMGAARLQQLHESARVLLHCDSCGNRDHYEAGTLRDALLIPSLVAKVFWPD
jgi:RNase P subunit RPR2